MSEMKKIYKRGFYGGKFLPFHKGHKYCIEKALEECEEVVVILFYGGEDEVECIEQGFICSPDQLKSENRIRIINSWCRNFANIRFVALDTEYIHNEAKLTGIDTWDAETKYVMATVGEFQAVYSSEPSYDAYFKRAYPFAEHRLVDVPRIHVPISGTMIRAMTDDEGSTWL